MVNGNSSLVFPPKSKQLTIIPETDIVLIEKRTKIRPCNLHFNLQIIRDFPIGIQREI